MRPEERWSGYLKLLRELAGTLEELAAVQQDKARAVRGDDLEALDACMKREQALSLSLRSLEGKREDALRALGAEQAGLRELAGLVPEPLRLEARKTEETLRRQYELYRGAADVARNTLECNLHEIEKLIAEQGGQAGAGPGYGDAEQPDLPAPMKTDFRA